MLGAPRNDRGSGALRKPPPCTPSVTPLEGADTRFTRGTRLEKDAAWSVGDIYTA